LIIIGGHEEKHDASEILRTVAERAGKGLLVVATLASSAPNDQWTEYARVFHTLGVKKVAHLDLAAREEAERDQTARLLADASLVFFGGGDQLRITSSFGGSALCKLVRQRHASGMPIAGTSAGASVMSETMLVSGPSDDSTRIGDSLRMAPGLGLISGFIIDQHFSQRGRIGRLLGAVAQNPRGLGLGIDENTAVLAHGERLDVIGEGAVYVVNGRFITYSNLSDAHTDDVLSVHGVRLDVLSRGDSLDLGKRVALRL